MSDSIRADKWLWATRFFKTRAIAAEILGDGKVKRNGHVLKRSSSIQPGDVLEIPFVDGPGVREILVKDVIAKRVGAPEARACYEDRTKPEVYETLKNWQVAKHEAPEVRHEKGQARHQPDQGKLGMGHLKTDRFFLHILTFPQDCFAVLRILLSILIIV